MHLIHTGRCPSYISDTVQLVADHDTRTGLRYSYRSSLLVQVFVTRTGPRYLYRSSLLVQVFVTRTGLRYFVQVFVTRTGLRYSYRSSLLVQVFVTRTGLRSASTSRYILPRLRTIFGERAFSFSGPKAWNSLPDQFHSIESTVSFKKSSKHFYSITLSSQQLVFIIVFYHACQSAIGHIFFNWRYINNLLTYLLTYELSDNNQRIFMLIYNKTLSLMNVNFF